jgi:hypothetical protein
MLILARAPVFASVLWPKTTGASEVLRATSAAEQWLIEEPEKDSSKVSRYQQCVLPHSVADDTRLTLTAFSLLCYRVRQSPSWGMSREELAREHGFGWRSFHAAVKTLAETGYMKRSQTKKKGARWYAQETLDFSEAQGARPGYQTLGRCIQGMPKKTLGLFDYLNSWPLNFVVTPKWIANRFNLSVKTVRRLMEPLLEAGLAGEDTISGSSVVGYVRRPRGQNGEATSGQNGEAPLKG